MKIGHFIEIWEGFSHISPEVYTPGIVIYTANERYELYLSGKKKFIKIGAMGRELESME